MHTSNVHWPGRRLTTPFPLGNLRIWSRWKYESNLATRTVNFVCAGKYFCWKGLSSVIASIWVLFLWLERALFGTIGFTRGVEGVRSLEQIFFRLVKRIFSIYKYFFNFWKYWKKFTMCREYSTLLNPIILDERTHFGMSNWIRL